MASSLNLVRFMNEVRLHDIKRDAESTTMMPNNILKKLNENYSHFNILEMFTKYMKNTSWDSSLMFELTIQYHQ